MTAITIINQLPFVNVILQVNQQTLNLSRVLLDTGSAATIFKTDDLMKLGLSLETNDPIHYMVGIGGREIVIEKEIEMLQVGYLTK
ncbi:hypothetical protein ACFLYO_04360, partial [Chloroflexota bacterium]